MAHILLIDDDPVIRTLLDDCLVSRGHTVSLAESGPAGLEMLKTAPDNVPDLFLIDFQMPQMNGAQVFKEIRSNQDWKNIPAIIFTAEPLALGEHLTGDEQPDQIIKKPFKVAEICDVIAELTSS